MSTNISTLSSWLWNPRNGSEDPSRTVVAIAVTILTVLGLARIVKKLRQAGPPLPPGPRGLPILGHLPFLGGTDLHKKFMELAKVYGPIFKLWLGNQLYVVVESPTVAKELVRDKDAIFANRDPPLAAEIMSYGVNNIVWSSANGPLWKKLRKLFAREMLTKTSLETSFELRKGEVRRVIRDVYKKGNSPVDIGELAFSTISNGIIRMLCGGSIRSEDLTNFVTEFRYLAEQGSILLAKPNISDFFPVFASFDFQGIGKQAKKTALSVERIIESMIKLRLNVTNKEVKEGAAKKDLLQILLDCYKGEDAETSITMDQLKGMVLDIILAGTDTSTTTIEWTMAELMKHQDVMEKVQKELNEVVGMNNIVEEYHLPKLHYLDTVMKEALRLHPVVPMLLPHSSSQSSTLGGYSIPKGATVFLNVYAIHRDPSLWPNPLEFKPDRFQNGNFDYMGNNFQYLPFGSGRRICAGLPLAEKMVMYVLATLLHSFDWKLPQGADLEFSEKFGTVVKKMNALILIPTPRLSSSELY